jgi:muconolactone delta-isomerase
MINIQLPKEFTVEFMSLIPKQRLRIDELMEDGKIINYSLAMDRSFLWTTVVANSKKEALAIISTFPLIDFMKAEIVELAFHNSISTDLPKLIMN